MRIAVAAALACVLFVGIRVITSSENQVGFGVGVRGPATMPSVRNSFRGISRPTRVFRKKDFHPEFHNEVPVFCNGEEVYKISGTSDKYVVDIWSGNHPFYQGSGNMVMQAGRIDQFKNKYEGLDDLFGDFDTADTSQGADLKKQAMEQLGIKKDKGKKKRK
eukprot:CAMPEP_0197515194 /NCGR_PEP_ID=MMETSP1318-20131121/399_1 /TAXON_ID=552666 /ORGANISM="Partenskyella glossopodia, Strain RCC365" /LENGTH=161 /DNA_ID=CAMNT_0043063501 /DNA_START=51 /DNA_END=536 /DNA_ORIENTATION=-